MDLGLLHEALSVDVKDVVHHDDLGVPRVFDVVADNQLVEMLEIVGHKIVHILKKHLLLLVLVDELLQFSGVAVQYFPRVQVKT